MPGNSEPGKGMERKPFAVHIQGTNDVQVMGRTFCGIASSPCLAAIRVNELNRFAREWGEKCAKEREKAVLERVEAEIAKKWNSLDGISLPMVRAIFRASRLSTGGEKGEQGNENRAG